MSSVAENSGPESRATIRDAARRTIGVLSALAWAALILATPLHFLHLGQTLWLDEVWTGAFAAQNTIGGLFHLILSDVNAPLYYVLEHYSAMVFGLSNVGLRLPGAILAAAAPFTVLVLRTPLAKETNLFWAAALALWIPGLYYAQDARCYALLFFLGTISTALFAQLIIRTERNSACAWAAVSLLLGLTHYDALLLVIAQGFILVAWHRGRAIALWAAALIFAPLPFWMALHMSTVLRYLAPQNSWYWLLSPVDVPRLINFLVNSIWVMLFAALLGLLPLWRRKVTTWPSASSKPAGRKLDPLWLVFGASLLPALAIIILGFIRPSFSDRYLMPFGPGILLGLALLAQRAKPYWKLAPVLLLLIFAAATGFWAVEQASASGKVYSFERASQSLIDAHVRKIVFFWDNPTSHAMDPQELASVASFFFDRAHAPVTIIPITLSGHEDPNQRLITEAKTADTAVLWLYDTNLPGTKARVHPFTIPAYEPAWHCQNFGDARFGVIACRQKRASTQTLSRLSK
jgi:uncharacterized membrane protein